MWQRAASLKRMLEQVGIEVRAAKAFPEDKEMLKTVLCKLADAGMVELVLTTGAVGFLEKHCAPDAVRETADRLLPGIPEALRAYNLRHTKKVILDRSEAGIRKKTLMINPAGECQDGKGRSRIYTSRSGTGGRYFFIKIKQKDGITGEIENAGKNIYRWCSARKPDGPGGYGTVLEYVDTKGQLHKKELSQGYEKTTNNRMELMAVIAGLEALNRSCEVEVYSDSQYVVNAFNQHWVDGWIKKGWKSREE